MRHEDDVWCVFLMLLLLCKVQIFEEGESVGYSSKNLMEESLQSFTPYTAWKLVNIFISRVSVIRQKKITGCGWYVRAWTQPFRTTCADILFLSPEDLKIEGGSSTNRPYSARSASFETMMAIRLYGSNSIWYTQECKNFVQLPRFHRNITEANQRHLMPFSRCISLAMLWQPSLFGLLYLTFE